MDREEYQNMQKHLTYITGLMVKDLVKVRGVEAIWDELENTAKITYYYDGAATEDELEDFSIACAEIIAHCSNGLLEEKYFRLDYPKPLPRSDFWGYKKQEK